MPDILSAIRFSEDPLIRKFLEDYDKTTDRDREVLPWEGFCLAGQIDPNAFFVAVVNALQNVSANTVKLLLFSHHPSTVAARIRNARKSHGYKDRDAIDTAVGLLPSPKGPTFIRKIVVNEAPAEEGPQEPGEVDMDFVFPSLSETQTIISRKSIAAPKD